MSRHGDALDAVVDKLVGAGLDAVTRDPRNLQAPGVLVGMPTGGRPAPCGSTATVSVWIVAVPPGNLDALDDLLERKEAVEAAVEWVDYEAGAYYPEGGGAGLPGYLFTVPIY